MASQGLKSRLMTEFKELSKEKWCNIELKDGNLMTWTIGLMVINSDSYYDGGYFKAELRFTDNYPYSPPSFKFLRPIYHPNIYTDGRVCISILHAPGADEMSGEDASERWSPLQGVESILRSILLLLDTPEIASPANVDSGVMYRDDRKSFILKAKTDVEKSKKDIPDGFVVPKTLMEEKPVVMKEDDAFWAESEEEDGWGGSDSSGEDAEMQDFEDEELDDDDEEGGQEFEDEEDDEETPKKQ